MSRIFKEIFPIISETNFYTIQNIATNNLFFIPYLTSKKMGNSDLVECCYKSLDYMYNNKKIMVIQGSYNTLYEKIIINYKNKNKLDNLKHFIFLAELIAYDSNFYTENEIINLRKPILNHIRKRRSLFLNTKFNECSLDDVRNVLNRKNQISLNDEDVRKLANKTSNSEISLRDLIGKKTNELKFTYTLNDQEISIDSSPRDIGKYKLSSFDFISFKEKTRTSYILMGFEKNQAPNGDFVVEIDNKMKLYFTDKTQGIECSEDIKMYIAFLINRPHANENNNVVTYLLNKHEHVIYVKFTNV